MAKIELISQSYKITDEAKWEYEAKGTYEVTLTEEEEKALYGTVLSIGTN